MYLLSDQVVALLVLEELVHLDDVGVVLEKERSVVRRGEAYPVIIDFLFGAFARTYDFL